MLRFGLNCPNETTVSKEKGKTMNKPKKITQCIHFPGEAAHAIAAANDWMRLNPDKKVIGSCPVSNAVGMCGLVVTYIKKVDDKTLQF